MFSARVKKKDEEPKLSVLKKRMRQTRPDVAARKMTDKEVRKLEKKDRDTPTLVVFILIGLFVLVINLLYLFGVVARIKSAWIALVNAWPAYLEQATNFIHSIF